MKIETEFGVGEIVVFLAGDAVHQGRVICVFVVANPEEEKHTYNVEFAGRPKSCIKLDGRVMGHTRAELFAKL